LVTLHLFLPRTPIQLLLLFQRQHLLLRLTRRLKPVLVLR
jgi:hypothetical protein